MSSSALVRIAAFSFEEKGSATERLGIVAEVRNDEIDRTQAFRVIKTCLASEHKISVSTIALIKSGSIPKTSSGKLRRFEARERLLDNTLDIINHGIWTAPVKTSTLHQATKKPSRCSSTRLNDSRPAMDTSMPSPIPSLKLAPLALAQLEDAIRQDHPHVEFQLEMMARHSTPKDLAAFLVQEDDTGKAKAIEPMPTLATHPSTTSDRISTVLHPTLRARACAEKSRPTRRAETPSIAGWLQGEVSIAALRRALDWLTGGIRCFTTFEQGKDGSYGQFVQTEWLQDFLITTTPTTRPAPKVLLKNF